MRVLIVGGSSYLGRSLCRKLADEKISINEEGVFGGVMRTEDQLKRGEWRWTGVYGSRVCGEDHEGYMGVVRSAPQRNRLCISQGRDYPSTISRSYPGETTATKVSQGGAGAD